MLAGDQPDAGHNILDICGVVSNDLGLANSWACLREVVKRVVIFLADAEQCCCTVDILTEISVVDLINIAFVHVTSEDGLGDVLWCGDLQKIEDSQELSFGNVAVFSAIKILEHRLQVNTSDLDSSTVLVKNSSQLFFDRGALEVLATCEQSVVLGYGRDTDCGCLVDTGSGECLVDACNEGNVVKETLGVVGLVFGGEVVVLLLGEVEVELAQNGEELILGDVPLSQFVKVEEELLDAHSLHHDERAETLLNIARVAGDVYTGLLVAIVNNINTLGFLGEEV